MNNLNFLKSKIIAHRGYFDEALGIPENSLPAFRRAIEYGFIIELDIHILKDNTIVVFHDDNLLRMTGENKLIRDCTYPELQKLHLKNSSEKIPTFEDVLKLVNEKVPLLIELKSDYKPKILVNETMKLLQSYDGRYAIQSFSPACIYYFKKHYPNVPRGQLSHSYNNTKIPFANKFLPLFNLITKPDFLSCGIKKCKNSKILKLKQKKLVLGWTIKDKTQYKEYKHVFSNLICENMQNYFKK